MILYANVINTIDDPLGHMTVPEFATKLKIELSQLSELKYSKALINAWQLDQLAYQSQKNDININNKKVNNTMGLLEKEQLYQLDSSNENFLQDLSYLLRLELTSIANRSGL